MNRHLEIIFNPPMAKGVGWMPPPTTGFSKFSQKWEELSCELIF